MDHVLNQLSTEKRGMFPNFILINGGAILLLFDITVLCDCRCHDIISLIFFRSLSHHHHVFFFFPLVTPRTISQLGKGRLHGESYRLGAYGDSFYEY